MAQEIKLQSEAKLLITLASWDEGHRLFKVVLRELMTMNRDLEMDKKVTLRLLASEEVEKALWPCMARASYNGLKIVPKLFDEYEGARSDFIEIAGEVLGFNLDPFFKNLPSKSSPATAS